ncbi:hypothetical protein ACOSP7_020285 [Xanthoceras sorbifolium]
MEIFKHLIFAFLHIIALTDLVRAQSQSGFISIDCGLPENSTYTDKETGIQYTSDAKFTESGVNRKISSEYYNKTTLEQPFLTLRSFPEGIRNCYTIKPARGNSKLLIRASFMYGNYDGLSKVPRFELLLGADVWDSVELANASTIVTKEILHVPQTNYVYVCLLNTGLGTPFMSSLELRPLKNSSYKTESGSLLLYLRLDLGSKSNKTIRYKDDIYDRIWSSYSRPDWTSISTSLPVNPDSGYQQPSAVMSTAVIPACSDSLTLSWKTCNGFQYYVYMHFSELQPQINNQTRQIYIYANGKSWYNGPRFLYYLSAKTVFSSSPMSNLEFSINKTEESSLPPMLNAIEIYQLKEFPQLLTNQTDVDAIMNIKKRYGVKRSNWQGDPCVPKVHLWQGLNCSYNDYNTPRIISLNLSSSGISGEILPYISSLATLESLDLSNNSLRGPVPDFLSQLAYLKVLNLTGNKLKGLVPAELIKKRDNGLLTLSVDRNPDLYPSTSRTKKKNIVVPILASSVAVSALISALSIIWNLKMRNQASRMIQLLKPTNITDEDWSQFASHRLSAEFDAISNKYSKLAKNNKTPHTTSNKGLARLHEDLKAKKCVENEDLEDPQVDRGESSIASHKRKDRTPVTEDAREINKEIEGISANQSTSILDNEGVSQVLGKENCGLVRGLFSGIIPTKVNASVASKETTTQLRSEMNTLKQQLQDLQSFVFNMQSNDKGRSEEAVPSISMHKKAKKCVENEDLEDPQVDRVESSIASHKCKDGTPVTEDAREINKEIEGISANQSTSILDNDVVSQVLGKENCGLVRGLFSGIIPTKVNAYVASKQTTAQLQSEMNTLKQQLQDLQSFVFNMQSNDKGRSEEAVPSISMHKKAKKCVENEDLEDPQVDRVESSIASHKRKDGTPVTEDAREINKEMEGISANQSTSILDNDAVSQVLGKENCGLVRGLCSGIIPTKVNASVASKQTTTQLQSEMNTLKQQLQDLQSFVFNMQTNDKGRNEETVPAICMHKKAKKCVENEDLEDPQVDRVESSIASHKRKDGTPVTEDTREINKEIEGISANQSTSILDNDVVSQVLGKENCGLVRGLCSGIIPTKVNASVASKQTTAQLRSEMNTLKQQLQDLQSVVFNMQTNDKGRSEETVPSISMHKSLTRAASSHMDGSSGKAKKCNLLHWMDSGEVVAKAEVDCTDPQATVT